MFSRFFTDPLNGTLLGSTQVKARRYLCLAKDGLSISLGAFYKKDVQLMRLSSSLLKGSWLLVPPLIKLFQPAILIEGGKAEEVVLLHSPRHFALWYLERGLEVDFFDSTIDEEVVSTHIFTLSWCDPLGKKFFHHILGVVTADGILYVQSYRPAPEVEPMCYRVKLPCSHALCAKFFRVASNMVICGVLDTEDSIVFVELAPTSHPRLVGTVKNPRKSSLVDFLVLRPNRYPTLQLALVYADGTYCVVEVTDWKIPPKSLSSHALPYHPQGVRFIESELGIHTILSIASNRVDIHEVSSGVSLLSEPFSGKSFNELDFFVTHTYRIEGLGLHKYEFFAPNSKQTQWMSSIQKTVLDRSFKHTMSVFITI